MNEKSDERDGPMSAKTIPFQIQVECAGRRYRGKESLEFWHGRDESQGDVERQCQETAIVRWRSRMTKMARPLLSIRIRPIGEVR